MAETLKGGKREQAEMQSALAALSINVARQREAEVKTKVNWINHQRVKNQLEAMDAEKIFEGRIVTWIFAGPYKGVSVRIRQAIPDDPSLPTDFKWTIKFDSQKEVPARVLKNKDEIESSNPLLTFEEAQEELGSVLNALKMRVDLEEPQLVVEKRRISYEVPKVNGERRKHKYRPLRVDLDTFVSVNDEKIVPRYVVEKEDISDLSEKMKRSRIDALAEMLRIKIDPEYAGLSTKGFLIKEGVIKEQYVLTASALAEETDSAA